MGSEASRQPAITKTADAALRGQRLRPPVAHKTLSDDIKGTAGNLAVVRALTARGVYAKLTVSQPGDPDEEEADRVADAVVSRSAVPAIQSKCDACASGKPCGSCEEDEVHAKRETGGFVPSPRNVGSAVAAIRGGGVPLPVGLRASYESQFSHDFSSVRLHLGTEAGASARGIGARAYTVGKDIAFAPGEYRPGDREGQRLLLHELAHVIQQVRVGGGTGSAATPSLQRNPDAKAGDSPAASNSPTQFPSKPPGATYTFEGLELSDNPEQVRSVLTTEVIKGRFSSVSSIPRHIDTFLNTNVVQARKDKKTVEGGEKLPGGVPWTDEEFRKADELRDKILPVVKQEIEALEKKRDDLIRKFEDDATTVAKSALADSRKHVLAEAVRYGVRDLRFGFTSFFGSPHVVGDVADNESTRGLAIAAQGLLDRKAKADKAMERYMNFTSGAPAIAELASQRLHSQEAEIAEYRAEIARTQKDFDVYRIQSSVRFPLIAALSNGEDFKRSELEDLAKGTKGKTSSVAEVIVDQVVEKLTNIAKLEAELKPGGDVNIWRVPKIVNPLRAKFEATPGTLNGRIIDDKIQAEQPSSLTEILIGILQIGLVLLAPFTEGLTLIPAAALSVGTAYQHFKEYQAQTALHGTDFGAAALSAEEPSLFWLAVDIVGAGFDVGAAAGPAVRIFRELAPVAKTIRGTQVAEDTVRTLEKRAGELGGETLAKRVGEDARAVQRGTSKEFGITAEEARKFEQAGVDVAAEELREGAQEAVTFPGGKVSVSRSGGIFSCNSPCTMIRERYRDLLVREPKYATRLNDLESRARALGAGPEADLARKQIANDAAALEKEMRTTALPGDWTSPLKDKADFDALVKRRGSIAAELDRHPPGWSGMDEAEFRYGPAAKAEPSYRWTLDERGDLRYDRLDASKPPHRFNAATGEFEEAAEEGLHRAIKGAEETRELAKLPQKEREAMEAAFKKRADFIAERDRLEALQEAGTIKPSETESLKKIYAKINEESRQLGEQAAEAIMSGKGGKKVYPLGKVTSTSGDFDQVWKIGGEFEIVEAKGGSSGLGSRAVGEGMRAEQGTVEYAKSIAENMAKNGSTKEIRQLGNELLAAIAEGKVKYVLVRAPIGTESGAAVLRDVKVSEFVIK